MSARHAIAHEPRHAVQFYETAEFLGDRVAEFVGASLALGDAAIFIATPEHLAIFEDRLAARGLDLESLRASERFVTLDARATLAELMVDGMPDRDRFRAVVGSEIARLASRYRVRAYGEMVHLLWQTNQPKAAIALEELWNDLGKSYPFDLLCAYSMGAFGKTGDDIAEVAHAHDHIAPLEREPATHIRALVDEIERHKRTEAELAQTIAALRTAEAQQRKLIEELSETVRINDLFTGVLAHDLRTPLSAIATAGQLLRSRNIPEPKPVDRILTSANRMARMIEQLLDYTRMRTGSLPVNPKPMDLVTAIDAIVAELQENHTEYEFKLERIGDSTGSWDEDRIQQVLGNLLGNAVQHGEGQQILIRVDGTSPHTVRFHVHNAGVIPSEMMNTLFLPMTKRTGKRHGLGLGLFIAKDVVNGHGGHIDVESTPERGTTFTITLPRQANATPTIERRGDVSRQTVLPVTKRTDRKEQSQRRLDLLIESIRDYAIFMLDPSGRVQTWNRGAQLAKGYTASEIIGQHISVFYPPEDRDRGRPQQLLARALEDGRVEDEGWRVRKDGTRFWADVVITALRDESGAHYGYAKVTRDLTERRNAEVERLRLAKAEEGIRQRDEFLSVVSHELKTPLTGLQLQLQLLVERAKEPKLVEQATKALVSGKRLSTLVESVLDLSGVSTGKFELRRERCDLANVVAEALEEVAPNCARAGCTIERHLEPAIGYWDYARLTQVVINLMSNSIKYGPDKPIDVSVGSEDGWAVLRIRDRGLGIEEADMMRIFDRFERGVSLRNYGGLGIGLYIIREIVRAHGGTVVAENAPGGGACFTVRLPRS